MTVPGAVRLPGVMLLREEETKAVPSLAGAGPNTAGLALVPSAGAVQLRNDASLPWRCRMLR